MTEPRDSKHQLLIHFARAANTVAYAISKSMVEAVPVATLGFSIGGTTERPRDRRLSRLDDARTAMEDGLAALDELRDQAVQREMQHQVALIRLTATLESQQTAEKKLQDIKDAMKADVDAFRTLHGVGDPKRERVVGFWTGAGASALVTVVWAVGSWAWGNWGFLLINRLQG